MSQPQRYTQLPVCVEPSYQAQEVVSPMAKTVKGGEWVKWEDYARLKAEVERLRKAGQWQPIETAPKDGTWFIAGFDGDLPSRHAWAAMCIWECGRFEVQETPDQPDYWMPLPKPQKEGKQP